MLFNELYGCYYNAVAHLLHEALNHRLTEKKLREICADSAFAESAMTIESALRNERWQLLRSDLSTPISHSPDLPPTTIELRWLKSITLDPRIALFDIDNDFLSPNGALANVQPLFTPQDIFITDKYQNGDPFTDPQYISNFKTLFTAVKNGKKARIVYATEKSIKTAEISPYLFEYSEREDRMRLWVNGSGIGNIINVARVKSAALLNEDGVFPEKLPVDDKENVTLAVTNSRMAVERALIHFSHYEKETELTDNGCIMRITYCKADRTELVQQVISFGPLVKVVEPESFSDLVKIRLTAQFKMENNVNS